MRPAHAAKAASTTIPIVFAVTADPVKAGLVSSLNRPGGNVTGVNFLLNMIAPKLFEVLQEAVPKPGTIGFLVNPTGAGGRSRRQRGAQLAAQALGQELLVVHASTEQEIDDAFATLAQESSRCAARGQRCVFLQPARADRGAGGAPAHAGDLQRARIPRRRAD